MEMSSLKFVHLLLVLLLPTLSLNSVNGQISTPCTAQMISSLTPCFNFITGSTANGTSTPTRDCCDLLKTMMGNSMDCACLLITASVPIQLPINRTLALSLPRACNMGGVPVQCKASGSPLPAPGANAPAPAPAPDLSPESDSPLSPRASKASPLAPAPLSDTSPPPMEADAPSARTGIRPVLTPSSSASHHQSHILPPLVILFFLGIMI